MPRLLSIALAALLAFTLPTAAEEQLSKWADLVKMLPDEAALNAARLARQRTALPFRVQKIDEATGKHVNLDRYEIRLSGLSPDDDVKLFEDVRRNLNDYFDHNAASLAGYAPDDEADWRSSRGAPLGSVLVFKIPLFWFIHEEAGVVTSQSAENRWVFTPVTLRWACPGEHPVSGNREFAFTLNPDGTGSIFTRGADRVLASCIPGEDTVFKGADLLWRSWQDKVAAAIRQRGGSATIIPPVMLRPTWEEVKKATRSP